MLKLKGNPKNDTHFFRLLGVRVNSFLAENPMLEIGHKIYKI